MKQERKKTEVIILTVILGCYLIFNGIMLAGHELWRDEANVWLIARELSPLQLLREIRYQGHPCLWYLLTMPFAKAGFPFQTLSVLSYFVMAVTAGIFVYQAPFHPVTKLICLMSPVFSYYYPVVARNYCLIALLLMLLALLYPERNEKPVLYGLLLGLLVQADTIALATAGLLSLMWLWEGLRQSLGERKGRALLTAGKGLWIPLASLGLWVLEFSGVSDSPEFQMRVLSISEFLSEVKNYSCSILTRMTGRGQIFNEIIIFAFIITGVMISLKIKSFWPMLVMAGTFLFEVVFSILVYQLHIWHYIMLCFALLWFFWMGGTEKKGTLSVLCRVLSEGLLVVLAVTMFMRWNSPQESSSLDNALHGLYSDGVNAAAYIRANVPEDELLFSTDVSEAATVQAYLGKSYCFYYAGSGQKAVYADYTDAQKQTVDYQDFLARVQTDFPEADGFYLLESQGNCIDNLSEETKSGFTVCYRTEGESARGEDYTLYYIKMK
jgi:hypothetical protein